MENKIISDKEQDCFWCDNKIKIGDAVDLLPGDRGLAHEDCAEEWHCVQMAEDEYENEGHECRYCGAKHMLINDHFNHIEMFHPGKPLI